MSVRLAQRGLLAAALSLALWGCSKPDDPFPESNVPGSAGGGSFVAETPPQPTPPEDLLPVPVERWRRFDLPEYQCSVVLPRAPEKVERPSGGHIYRIHSGAVDFWIRLDRLQDSGVEASPDRVGDVLTGLIRDRAQRFASEVIEQRHFFHRGMRAVRTTLVHYNAQTIFYWLHVYDHHARRIISLGISAFELDADREADTMFQSFEIAVPELEHYHVTAKDYARELAADGVAASQRYAHATVEVTGRVSELRIETGAFPARHRIVVLSGERKGGQGVECSVDGSPWERLSPGARATIRGRAAGLSGGLLVNCEIVETDGEPCLAAEADTFVEELSRRGDSARSDGRWIVLTGTVVRNHTADLRNGRYGVLLSGRPEHPVFCESDASLDPSLSRAVYGSRAVVLGRYASNAQRPGEVVLTDCFLIESVRR